MGEIVDSDRDGIKDSIVVEPGTIKSCLYNGKTVLAGKGNCRFDFYLVRTAYNYFRYDDLARVLSGVLLCYACKKSEYVSMKPKDVIRLAKTAKSRLKRDDNGEVGELLLFTLLEDERKAPQVINKMALKTDGNMHFHGLDGVHMGIDGEGKDEHFVLFYGESKVYGDLKDGARKAISGAKTIEDDIAEEDFEFDLIRVNIDWEKFGKYTQNVLNFLDPYYEDKENIEKRHSIFIGFNWSCLRGADCLNDNDDQLMDKMKSIIEKNAEKIIAFCVEQVDNSKAKYHFDFFFTPFEDTGKFREMLLKEIG